MYKQYNIYNMKLQNEIDFAISKVNKTIERNGLDKVREYMNEVYLEHDWINFETRIACEIVKNSIGNQTICDWYEKYACTDKHIVTLCIAVMKAVGLLPFKPNNKIINN